MNLGMGFKLNSKSSKHFIEGVLPMAILPIGLWGSSDVLKHERTNCEVVWG
jgi:hypothetical protein